MLVPILLAACGDADAGLSRTDVAEIVRSELINVPAPADQNPPCEEIEQIVRASIADIPKPQLGLTSAEAEQIVQAAIASILGPKPGATGMRAKQMAESMMGSAPPKSTPADYTRFLVRGAISRYGLLFGSGWHEG